MVSILNALNGALQTNIFAVQQIQSQISEVQARLSSGSRVNSILDNPNSFILSTSLSSRASRLNTVLDNIITKVTEVNQADESLTAVSDLYTQLQGVGEDAEQVLIDNPTDAEITGNRNLSSYSDLVAQVAGIDNGDSIVLTFFDDTDAAIDATKVGFSPGTTINDVIDDINNIVNSSAAQVFEASLNGSGQLNIRTKNDIRFEILFQDGGSNANPQLANALGFGDYVTNEVDNGVAETRITVSPTPALTTNPLFNALSPGTAATSSTRLLALSDTAGGPVLDIFSGDATDSLAISINGETASTVVSNLRNGTVGDLINGINNGALGSKIQATLATDGSITIRAVDSSVESIQFELHESNNPGILSGLLDLLDLGIGLQNLATAVEGNGEISSESIQLGPGASDLADLEAEYNDVRTQIDDLVDDSEFNDVNLLNGDNLIAILSEDTSSILTIEGVGLKVDDLSVSTANFANNDKIQEALTEVDDALNEISAFADSLANDLEVLETRQSFTEESISNANQGITDLTQADTEQDSALLLALQARKDISITVLGLTSQGQVSVLRAFTGFQNV